MAKPVDNYATFVAMTPILKNASSSFGTFYDEDGNRKYITYSVDPRTGQDIVWKFKFGRDKRYITVPFNKKDSNGNSVVDFLRNHPLNANSPYPDKNPWFKEIDNGRDAEIAIDSLRLRNDAENKALGLKAEELEEVCKVLGFTGDAKIKLHKVLQFATKNPTDFLTMVEDPNRSAKALFESAYKNKIITRKGFMYQFQEVHIGNDKEKAIIKIADDKELQEIIANALKKAGV